MVYALVGARIFDGEQFFDQHALIMDGDRFGELVPEGRLPSSCQTVELDGGMLAPGFVDLQVNGGGGVLFNNRPSVETLNRMTRGHRSQGTTSLLPTTISDSPANLAACIEAVKAGQAVNPGILGMHIEGPFFSEVRRGVHRADYLRPLQDTDVDCLVTLAGELRVLLTLAPEMVQPGQVRRLAEAGIRVSAGHTNATHAQVVAAIDEGLGGFTHLYNAMSPMQGREPGVVGTALSHHGTYAGIIVDGYHVHPGSVRLAWQSKPRGHLYLVSDAMATVGAREPWFDLYGERITEQEGRLINAEGRLAGSAIGMMDAVRTTVEQVDIPLDEALRMAARYPAEYFGVADCLGFIRPGYRADLVHFSDELTVHSTWLAGDNDQQDAGRAACRS